MRFSSSNQQWYRFCCLIFCSPDRTSAKPIISEPWMKCHPNSCSSSSAHSSYHLSLLKALHFKLACQTCWFSSSLLSYLPSYHRICFYCGCFGLVNAAFRPLCAPNVPTHKMHFVVILVYFLKQKLLQTTKVFLFNLIFWLPGDCVMHLLVLLVNLHFREL